MQKALVRDASAGQASGVTQHIAARDPRTPGLMSRPPPQCRTVGCDVCTQKLCLVLYPLQGRKVPLGILKLASEVINKLDFAFPLSHGRVEGLGVSPHFSTQVKPPQELLTRRGGTAIPAVSSRAGGQERLRAGGQAFPRT